MKKLLLILILISSFTIAQADGADKDFFGFGTEYAFCNMQHSINAGLTIKKQSVSINWYFIGCDWIAKDKYNDNKATVSYMGLINCGMLGFFIPMELCKGTGNTGLEYFFGALALAPSLLTNTKICYNFLSCSNGEKNQSNLGIAYRHKVDYFSSNDVDFWRYCPALSLEYKLINGSCAVSASAGIAYPIDWLKSGTRCGEFFPKFGIEIAFGALRDPNKK